MGQDGPNGDSPIGRIVPNIGLEGVESIRIGGMTLDTLPMAEAAITRQQWSKVERDAARQEVETILGDYPKATIVYLKSRITECEDNIGRIRGMKADQQNMIDEYSGQISLCAHRDQQIAKLNPDDEADNETIKALRIQFPPYDVGAMKQQIEQCKESIVRCDVVIDKEHESIAELRDTISLCKRRDELLAPYGVQVG